MSSTLLHNKTQFIDLEMLCWDNKIIPEGQSQHIIQIGIVEVDAVDFTISRKQSYYVRPPNKNFECSDYCINLTGITKDKLIAEGHYLPQVMRTIFKDYCPSRKVTYAWGNDQKPISEQCRAATCDNPWETTGIWDFGVVFRNAFNMKNKLPLAKALAYLNVEFPGVAHDAMNDAHALALLHIEMMQRIRNYK